MPQQSSAMVQSGKGSGSGSSSSSPLKESTHPCAAAHAPGRPRSMQGTPPLLLYDQEPGPPQKGHRQGGKRIAATQEGTSRRRALGLGCCCCRRQAYMQPGAAAGQAMERARHAGSDQWRIGRGGGAWRRWRGADDPPTPPPRPACLAAPGWQGCAWGSRRAQGKGPGRQRVAAGAASKGRRRLGASGRKR